MKALAFLELVGKMLTAQQDYFKAKRTGDPRAKELLIMAKELEKRCWAVIKDGRLEPDVTAGVTRIYTEQEYQEQMDLAEIDMFGTPRPTDKQGDEQ